MCVKDKTNQGSEREWKIRIYAARLFKCCNRSFSFSPTIIVSMYLLEYAVYSVRIHLEKVYSVRIHLEKAYSVRLGENLLRKSILGRKSLLQIVYIQRLYIYSFAKLNEHILFFEHFLQHLLAKHILIILLAFNAIFYKNSGHAITLKTFK